MCQKTTSLESPKLSNSGPQLPLTTAVGNKLTPELEMSPLLSYPGSLFVRVYPPHLLNNGQHSLISSLFHLSSQPVFSVLCKQPMSPQLLPLLLDVIPASQVRLLTTGKVS